MYDSVNYVYMYVCVCKEACKLVLALLRLAAVKETEPADPVSSKKQTTPLPPSLSPQSRHGKGAARQPAILPAMA